MCGRSVIEPLKWVTAFFHDDITFDMCYFVKYLNKIIKGWSCPLFKMVPGYFSVEYPKQMKT